MGATCPPSSREELPAATAIGHVATRTQTLHRQKTEQEKVHQWEEQTLGHGAHILTRKAIHQVGPTALQKRCQTRQPIRCQAHISIHKDQ
jgi:hypothetical protein